MEPGREFDSFESFKTAIDEYSKENRLVYTIADCRSVETANKKNISANGVPYAKKFKYSYVKFACKHYGQAKSASTGKRPNQRTYKTSCPSSIFATTDRKKDRLIILRSDLSHNHPVSQDLFIHYPERRRITEEQKELVRTLSRLCVTPAVIARHVGGLHGKCLTVKDIQNIRKQGKTVNELGSILEVLEEICDNAGNRVVINAREDGEILGIYFQTAEQRELFQRFPEVVHMDGTYRINNRRLSLYVALIEDGHGKGAAVGYALLCDETKESIEFFVDTLKANNEAMDRTRCFIVDRDFTEIAVISSRFPSAKIQLCLFHVLKALRTEVNKLTADESSKDQIRDALQDVVYSFTEDGYDGKLREMKLLCPAGFFRYFLSNWDACKHLWATYITKSYPNFRTKTNNRIERHNQELKKVLSSNMTVADCIRAIIGKVKEQTARKSHSNFLTAVCQAYNVEDDDSNIQRIRHTATEYAAKLAVKHFRRAEELAPNVAVQLDQLEGVSATVTLKDLDEVHHVTLDPEASCTCSSWLSLQLPCWHIFSAMSSAHLSFQDNWIIPRWRKSYQRPELVNDTSLEPLVLEMPQPDVKKLGRTEKFSRMKRVLLEIADLSSEVSQEEFDLRYEQVVKLRDAWLMGSDVHIAVGESTLEDGRHCPNAGSDPSRQSQELPSQPEDPPRQSEDPPTTRRPRQTEDASGLGNDSPATKPPRPTQDSPGQRADPPALKRPRQDAPGQSEIPSAMRPLKPAQDAPSQGKDPPARRQPTSRQDSPRRGDDPPTKKQPRSAQDVPSQGKDPPAKRRPTSRQDAPRQGEDQSAEKRPRPTQDAPRQGEGPPIQKRPRSAQDAPSKSKDPPADGRPRPTQDSPIQGEDPPTKEKPRPAQGSPSQSKDPPAERRPTSKQDAHRQGEDPPTKKRPGSTQDAPRQGNDPPTKKQPRPAQDAPSQSKDPPAERRPTSRQDAHRQGEDPPTKKRPRSTQDAPRQGNDPPTKKQPRPAQDAPSQSKDPPAKRRPTSRQGEDPPAEKRPRPTQIAPSQSEDPPTGRRPTEVSQNPGSPSPKPRKSCLKQQSSTKGLYLPKIRKVRGRPKGTNTSVLGVRFKTNKKGDVSAEEPPESPNLDARKISQLFDDQRLLEHFNLMQTFQLNVPTGVCGSLQLIRSMAMSPPNGVIFEAARDPEQLEHYEDALSTRLVQLIRGPSPTKNTSLLQLSLSAAYLSIKDDLDLHSLEEMLCPKPSHLTELLETVHNTIHTKMKVGNNSFTAEDLGTLKHGKWLNDQVIHAYLGLLMMEHPGKVYVLPSFLAVKWDRGHHRHWLYKKIDFCGFRWIIIPINRNNHWFLMVVDMLHRTVSVLNSLPDKQTEARYIEHWNYYVRVRNMHTAFHLPEFVQTSHPCGRQYDGHSCGIFLLMNAEAIVSCVKPAVMRQHHCLMYREYVRKRLLAKATRNQDIMCDLPFCMKPSGEISWVLCDHCDRWCHYVCCGIQEVSKEEAFRCLICSDGHC